MLNETTIIKINDNFKKEDFDYILNTIIYVKLCILLFVLIIIKIVLTKTINICKKAYTVHNERVIRQHGTTSQT